MGRDAVDKVEETTTGEIADEEVVTLTLCPVAEVPVIVTVLGALGTHFFVSTSKR